MLLLLSADFFLKGLDPDQNRHSVGPDQDPNILSVLIRIQTVCKGYQQTTSHH